jgi:Domain of unknown function (DUF397)
MGPMPHSNNESERPNWRKAKRSMNNGNCAEVGATAAGVIAVRDSKDPEGLVLRYQVNSWTSFLVATRNGRFDSLG